VTVTLCIIDTAWPSPAIACCSVIWHSLHTIFSYDFSNQPPVPASGSAASQRLPEERKKSLPARTASWKYSQRSCFGQIITPLLIFPEKCTQSSSERASPPGHQQRLLGADLSKGEHFEVCASWLAANEEVLQMRPRWLWVFTKTRCPALPGSLREPQKNKNRHSNPSLEISQCRWRWRQHAARMP